jgi:hypothetical protein
MNTNVSVTGASASRLSDGHRVLYFLSGMGLIITLFISPPEKSIWIAVASMLAIGLASFSIIGQIPKIRFPVGNEADYKVVNTRLFHTLLSIIVGVGIIILVTANHPVSTVWITFFNLLGITIVLDTIISSHYLFERKARQILIDDEKVMVSPSVHNSTAIIAHAV